MSRRTGWAIVVAAALLATSLARAAQTACSAIAKIDGSASAPSKLEPDEREAEYRRKIQTLRAFGQTELALKTAREAAEAMPQTRVFRSRIMTLAQVFGLHDEVLRMAAVLRAWGGLLPSEKNAETKARIATDPQFAATSKEASRFGGAALDSVRANLERNPNSPEAIALMIPALRRFGMTDEAMGYALRWLELEPDSPEAGQAALELRLDLVRKEVKRMLKGRRDGEALERLGLRAQPAPPAAERSRALFDAGEDAHALDAAEQALAENPHDETVFKLLIGPLRKLGRSKAAMVYLRRWLEKEPGLPEALALEPLLEHEIQQQTFEQEIRDYRLANELELALATARAASSAYPDNKELRWEIKSLTSEISRRAKTIELAPAASLDAYRFAAETAENDRRLGDALALIIQAEKGYPKEIWLRHSRIDLLRKMGRREEIVWYVNERELLETLDVELLTARASAHVALNDRAEALADIEELADRELPVPAQLLRVQSSYLSHFKDFAEALAAADASLAIEPNSNHGALVRAVALFGLGRFNEASEMMPAVLADRALERIVSLRLKGRIEARLGRWTELDATADEMIAIKPGDREGWANRALSRLRRLDYVGCLEAIRVSLKLAPGNVHGLKAQGQAQSGLGFFDAAWASAAEMPPGFYRAILETRILIDQRRWPEAEAVAATLGAARYSHWLRAELAAKQPKFTEARRSLLELLAASKTRETRRGPIAGLIKISLMEDPTGESLEKIKAKSDPSVWAAALARAVRFDWQVLSDGDDDSRDDADLD